MVHYSHSSHTEEMIKHICEMMVDVDKSKADSYHASNYDDNRKIKQSSQVLNRRPVNNPIQGRNY